MRGTGFSKIVSVGNAIGVNFHDYIDYLKEDPDTKVIMAYLEGIKERRQACAGGEGNRKTCDSLKGRPIKGRSKSGCISHRLPCGR